MQQLFRLLIFLIFLNQTNMFRATNSTILRSTFWLYIQLLVQCTDTAANRYHRSAEEAVHCTKSCIYSQKVLLRMGEFVDRNMLVWFKKIKKINKRKTCCILLVVYIVVLMMHGHTNIKICLKLNHIHKHTKNEQSSLPGMWRHVHSEGALPPALRSETSAWSSSLRPWRWRGHYTSKGRHYIKNPQALNFY